MNWQLKKISDNTLPGPLILVILDGMGIYRGVSQGYLGNAIDHAYTPALDRLQTRANIRTMLKAHGTAVGLPSDGDMGNSEVGHNAIGAGRIFDQGAKLVNKAIDTGSLFRSQTWMEYIGTPEHPGHLLRNRHVSSAAGRPPALHLIGLVSDGNVHSHISHLYALIDESYNAGVTHLFVHSLIDGRDVEEVSAEKYIEPLARHLSTLREQGVEYWIASGGGRMVITMDRYEANWDWVERGWHTHVLGEGRLFPDALTAIYTLRDENPGIIDQDLPPFVISDEKGSPRGTIHDGDVVIFFNYRGDRAIEISRAFTEADFRAFDRKRVPQVLYAGMMEYDGDLHIPPRYLVEPPAIDRTISEYLVHQGITQFAIAETQKYGHVTYFWNGNNSEKFDPRLEDWVEIPSDRIAFELKPVMKAYEVTDTLINALKSGKYSFLRVNYANGDMVGHTGILQAAVEAAEAVDRNLCRLVRVVDRLKGTLIITADHGNCEQMFEVDKKSGKVKRNEDGSIMSKTSHTLNPVNFLLHGPHSQNYELTGSIKHPGLANIAATILTLLGFAPPDDYEQSLIQIR